MSTKPTKQQAQQAHAARRDAKYWRGRAEEAEAQGKAQDAALFRRSAADRDAAADKLERGRG